LTVMWSVSKSLSAGVPLSVTLTVTVAVTGPSGGVHVNTPVVALIVAPAGAPASRLNANTLDGRSASVATAVNVRRLPSTTDLSPIGARSGARFTSVTWMVNVFARSEERRVGKEGRSRR